MELTERQKYALGIGDSGATHSDYSLEELLPLQTMLRKTFEERMAAHRQHIEMANALADEMTELKYQYHSLMSYIQDCTPIDMSPLYYSFPERITLSY